MCEGRYEGGVREVYEERCGRREVCEGRCVREVCEGGV